MNIHLGVELAAYMVISHLAFCETDKLFSTVTASFYILISNVQGFQFLHILTNTYYFYFIIAILVRVKWWSGIALWFGLKFF